jgi:starvation-inducible DNA-binding protein
MAALGSLPETKGVPGARAMMQALLDGHLAVAAGAKAALATAEDAGDPATADLLTQRIASHEKTAWMLRAMLSEEGSAA